MPDQAVGAQQAECRCHFLAVEVAFFGHRLFKPLDAVLVEEDLDVVPNLRLMQLGTGE
jgi:hypothetical protein